MVVVYLILLFPTLMLGLMLFMGTWDHQTIAWLVSGWIVTFMVTLVTAVMLARRRAPSPVNSHAIGRWSSLGALVGAPLLLLVAHMFGLSADHLGQVALGLLPGVSLALAVFMALVRRNYFKGWQ